FMCSSFPGLLIGRTAVHSGKDPAFVAYDQFLSTGILQPLSRGEVRCGSKPVKLGTSKCFQVCPRKRTYLPILELLPPPALGERRHRRLARRRVAVRRRAVLVVPEGEGPHPGRADWRGTGLIDAADNFAVRKHVEIVIVPMARWAACRRSL